MTPGNLLKKADINKLQAHRLTSVTFYMMELILSGLNSNAYFNTKLRLLILSFIPMKRGDCLALPN